MKKKLKKTKKISNTRFAKQKTEKEKLEKKASEYLAGWQRAQADFLNFKKSQEKLLPLLIKHANEELICSLLPVLDSYDLAMAHSKDRETIKQLQQQILGILKTYGLEEIKTLDQKFNPALHESVGQVKSEGKPNQIIEVLQKGYKMHEKTIRAAKVKIAV